jgi:hypothetical protein
MNERSLPASLWRLAGGVLGVSLLLGLAYAIGWLHQGGAAPF